MFFVVFCIVFSWVYGHILCMVLLLFVNHLSIAYQLSHCVYTFALYIGAAGWCRCSCLAAGGIVDHVVSTSFTTCSKWYGFDEQQFNGISITEDGTKCIVVGRVHICKVNCMPSSHILIVFFASWYGDNLILCYIFQAGCSHRIVIVVCGADAGSLAFTHTKRFIRHIHFIIRR